MTTHRTALAAAASLLLMLATGAAALGPWRATAENTRGWRFMTSSERIEHQARIRSFKTLDECRAYQAEHHRLMEQRARERGMALPGRGRDICEHLKPPG